MLKPAAAGVLVGLHRARRSLRRSLPGTGGCSRAWPTDCRTLALWVILALPFVKILSTSLSIGSGGSGGIFGPGMVIGGFVGLSLWRVLTSVAPGMPGGPAPFMVVGMIACFGSIAHAPLGLMLMVAEMTGSLALLPPAMVAIGLATLVVGDDSIYESQLRSRADAPAHRAAFGMPLLSAVPVAEVMATPRLLLPGDIPTSDALAMIVEARSSRRPRRRRQRTVHRRAVRRTPT